MSTDDIVIQRIFGKKKKNIFFFAEIIYEMIGWSKY